jgi:hypothetical protein
MPLGEPVRMGEWGWVFKNQPYQFWADSGPIRYVANCDDTPAEDDIVLEPGTRTFDLIRDDGRLIRLTLEVSCDDSPPPGPGGPGTQPQPQPIPAPSPMPAPSPAPRPIVDDPRPVVAPGRAPIIETWADG